MTRPGGTLMLTTPNLYSAANLLRMRRRLGVNDIYDEYAKLRRIGHMGHVREYAPKEVAAFLSHFGFMTRRIEYREHRARVWRSVKGRLVAAAIGAAANEGDECRFFHDRGTTILSALHDPGDAGG